MLPDEFYGALKKNNPNFGMLVKRALKLMGLPDTNAIYDALVSSWQGGEDAVLNGTTPLTPLQDKSQWPDNLSFLDEMIFGDLLSYRINDLMVKTDRASMAVALEARAPLMDYKLAEYAWRLPPDMKVKNAQGKWLLRQVLSKHIPEDLYERPKMGFSIPLNLWLQGSLKEWGSDLLAEERLKNQGLFDVDLIRDTWNNFQICDGAQSSRKDLWTILMFQAWHKEWMK